MIIVAGGEIEYYCAGEDDNRCSPACTGVLERVSLAKVPNVDLLSDAKCLYSSKYRAAKVLLVEDQGLTLAS